jgi:hypothetical protein
LSDVASGAKVLLAFFLGGMRREKHTGELRPVPLPILAECDRAKHAGIARIGMVAVGSSAVD